MRVHCSQRAPRPRPVLPQPLIDSGVIHDDTLVWAEGMEDWQRWADARERFPVAAAAEDEAIGKREAKAAEAAAKATALAEELAAEEARAQADAGAERERKEAKAAAAAAAAAALAEELAAEERAKEEAAAAAAREQAEAEAGAAAALKQADTMGSPLGCPHTIYKYNGALVRWRLTCKQSKHSVHTTQYVFCLKPDPPSN